MQVVARPGRFERPTSGSGDQRSIQLSYGRAEEAQPEAGAAEPKVVYRGGRGDSRLLFFKAG